MSKHIPAWPPEQARLTLRIPAEKARNLRQLARLRGLSVNSLLDEMVSLALFESRLQQHDKRNDGHGGELLSVPRPQAAKGCDPAREASRGFCGRTGS